MITEPEGLVAWLVDHIACSSLHGCSIDDVLGEAKRILHDGSKPRDFSEVPSFPSARPGETSEGFAFTIWKWLMERRDVLVGREGEWNHVSLDDLLRLPADEPIEDDDTKAASLQAPHRRQPLILDGLPSCRPRLYASEERTWEAIAGHGVDHQRIPKSQWEALLGIASAGVEGIIQGNLRRLIGQDKRSLPHRTNLLAQKGYVIKRTTLIKRCKTSKIWLKRFAPSLPRNTTEPETTEMEAEMSAEVLTSSDVAVPWHSKWTEGTIDMVVLGKTIMAILKAWEVMRFKDLKAKLGVQGRSWEMRVVARSCRFLAMRGCVKYVVATWDGRLLRDCIKYLRDLGPDDWSTYLSNGAAKRLRQRLPGNSDDAVQIIHATQHSTNSEGPRSTSHVVWSPDEPLSLTLSGLVHKAGHGGVRTPELVHMTLGSSFRRYVSSASSAMALENIQPAHLGYLGIRRELMRVGKAAVFTFLSAKQHPQDNEVAQRDEEKCSSQKAMVELLAHGFVNLARPPGFGCGAPSIRAIAMHNAIDKRKDPGKRGRPAKATSTPARGRGRPRKVVPDQSSPDQGGHIDAETLQKDGDASLHDDADPAGSEAVSPQNTKLGRGKHARKSDALSRGKFKCEKCGNTWKNDVGLKYHVTKSKTDCNPEWVKKSLEAAAPAESPLPDEHLVQQNELGRGSSRVSTLRGRKDDVKNGKSKQPDASEIKNEQDSTATGREAPEAVGRASRGATSRSLDAKAMPGTEFGQVRRSTSATVSENNPQYRRPMRQIRTFGKVDKVNSVSASNAVLNLTVGPRLVANDPVSSHPISTKAPRKRQESPRQHGHESNTQNQSPISPISSRGSEVIPAPSSMASNSSPVKLAPFPMPIFEGGKRKTEEHVVSSRISAVALWLVDGLGGVFPGGNSLSVSLGKVWQHYFLDDPAPSHDRCAAEIRKLINKRILREEVHSFRGPSGVFVNCPLVMQPNIDSLSSKTTEIIAKTKEAYPEPWLPDFVQEDRLPGNDEEPENPVLTFTGRRTIVGKVEVLSAPFYMNGLPERKRRLPRPPIPGTKRIKLDDESTSGRHLADRPSYYRGPKVPSEDRAPIPIWGEEDSDIDDGEYDPSLLSDSPEHLKSQHMAGMEENSTTHATIRFLEPNTYLDKDYVGSHEGASAEELQAYTTSEINVPAIKGHFEMFMPTIALGPVDKKTDDWEFRNRKWFEDHDNSFAVKAWMPDHTWLDLERLPIQAQGLYTRRVNKLEGLQDGGDEASYLRFAHQVKAIHDVELRSVNRPRMMPSCGWPTRMFINLSSERASPLAMPAMMKWTKGRQLTIRTAPKIYGQEAGHITDSEDDPDWDPLTQGQERTPRRRHSQKRSRQYKSWRSRPMAKQDLKTRALTALIGHQPAESNISRPVIAKTRKESKKREDGMLIAFLVIRALLGGTTEAIDWGLMMRLFPEMDLDGLRRYWTRCRKLRPGFMTNFTNKFQRAFVKAYSRDEIPPIDYENTHAYDWLGLIQWARKIRLEDDFPLPRTKAQLSKTHGLLEEPNPRDGWQEKFYHPQTSIFARLEVATANAAALPIRTIDVSDIGMQVARSWIKSLCGTPSGRYTSDQIRERFGVLKKGEPRYAMLLEQAVQELTLQKTICKSDKRVQDPRPYRLSEQFYGTLAKLSQAQKYSEAARFKRDLDDIFARNEKLRLPYNVKDGATMAYINLQANHRISIQPVDVPQIPLGFEPGRYETRKFPKSYYHFGLEIIPSALYLYNDAIHQIAAAVGEQPSKEGVNGELPIWCDFFGQVEAERWRQLVGAFAFLIATRGPLTVSSLSKAMRPLVDNFEVELMVEWSTRVGLAELGAEGQGIRVSEWWWLMVSELQFPVEGVDQTTQRKSL